jgi:hypothetical protein
MRSILLRSLAALACFGIFGLPQTFAAATDKPNFNGIWALDHSASAPLEPLMTRIGAGLLERKFADRVKLKATIRQNERLITVATRGFGFSLDETLYLDGDSHPSHIQILGATCLSAKTAWSKQLVVTYQIKTKQGKEGRLIVKRYLTNGGKTEVVAYALNLDGDSDELSARQIWTKEAEGLAVRRSQL